MGEEDVSSKRFEQVDQSVAVANDAFLVVQLFDLCEPHLEIGFDDRIGHFALFPGFNNFVFFLIFNNGIDYVLLLMENINDGIHHHLVGGRQEVKA